MSGQSVNAANPASHNAKRARATLVLIFVLFALPLLTAWLLNFTGDFKPGTTVNTGTLIQPVRSLVAVRLHDLHGDALDPEYFKGKWTLLFRHTGECGESCHQAMYVLRQVRLAQGKNIDRVQRLMLVDSDASPAWAAEVAQHYPGLVLARTAADRDAAAFQQAERIYLVDPLGNLMMEYALDADPRGMIKDLERLLRISYVG